MRWPRVRFRQADRLRRCATLLLCGAAQRIAVSGATSAARPATPKSLALLHCAQKKSLFFFFKFNLIIKKKTEPHLEKDCKRSGKHWQSCRVTHLSVCCPLAFLLVFLTPQQKKQRRFQQQPRRPSRVFWGTCKLEHSVSWTESADNSSDVLQQFRQPAVSVRALCLKMIVLHITYTCALSNLFKARSGTTSSTVPL